MEQLARKKSQDDDANAIADSHVLDGDPQRLSDYYRGWARRYDEDVMRAGYRGPQLSARLLEQYVPGSPAMTEVLDAGCGTGLSGLALFDRGFSILDGFDLCDEMVHRARERGVYRKLLGGVDMNQIIPDLLDGVYDAVMCCGVFTLGHVKPRAMKELIRVTRQGGLLVISTRISYCRETKFADYVQKLIAARMIRLITCLSGAPYINGEEAHYWVFERV